MPYNPHIPARFRPGCRVFRVTDREPVVDFVSDHTNTGKFLLQGTGPIMYVVNENTPHTARRARSSGEVVTVYADTPGNQAEVRELLEIADRFEMVLQRQGQVALKMEAMLNDRIDVTDLAALTSRLRILETIFALLCAVGRPVHERDVWDAFLKSSGNKQLTQGA